MNGVGCGAVHSEHCPHAVQVMCGCGQHWRWGLLLDERSLKLRLGGPWWTKYAHVARAVLADHSPSSDGSCRACGRPPKGCFTRCADAYRAARYLEEVEPSGPVVVDMAKWRRVPVPASSPTQTQNR